MGRLRLAGGASYNQEMVEGGTPGDYWVYEDRVIYVHKRLVAIPLEATPDGDISKFDRIEMNIARSPTTRCDRLLRPEGARRGPRARGSTARWRSRRSRASAADVLEGHDQELGLECVQAYNDWMVEEWSRPSGGRLIPLCLIPLWDVELAAEVTRNAARGARAVCFSEIPAHLGLPSIHTGYWDPFFAACEATGTTLCMHIGSSSKMPVASPDAPPSADSVLAFNNSMASLMDFLFSGVLVRFPTLSLAYSEGQIGWIPYASSAPTTWEIH